MKQLSLTLGSVFFTDDVKSVNIERVKAALDASGLDPELASELSKRYRFSRAKNRLNTDGLVEEVNDTDKKWIFQLSARYREANKLSYEFEAQFWFNKETEQVEADNTQLQTEIGKLFAQYGETYLPSDVNGLIRRVFSKQRGMLSLRHHGVVYFVPKANFGIVEKIEKFLRVLGGECTIIPIGPENKAVKDKAANMLVEDVKADLTRITAELATLREKGEGFTNRKANNRWKELLGQLDRLKMFATSLQVDTSSLLGKVRNAELDLALVSGDNLDVIAALAHAGKIKSTLGTIAAAAYDGELPKIDSPRVKQVMDQMMPDVEVPVILNVAVKAKMKDLVEA